MPNKHTSLLFHNPANKTSRSRNIIMIIAYIDKLRIQRLGIRVLKFMPSIARSGRKTRCYVIICHVYRLNYRWCNGSCTGTAYWCMRAPALCLTTRTGQFVDITGWERSCMYAFRKACSTGIVSTAFGSGESCRSATRAVLHTWLLFMLALVAPCLVGESLCAPTP